MICIFLFKIYREAKINIFFYTFWSNGYSFFYGKIFFNRSNNFHYLCRTLYLGFFLLIIYIRPLLLTSLEFKSLFLCDLSELTTFILIYYQKNYAGNVLLSHVLRQSTIGAEGLDFRVRNGIGYGPFAIIAGT